MTLFEQYKKLENEAGKLAAERRYLELEENGEKAKAIRDQFTTQDWIELIAHSSGKAQYEYIKMFTAHFEGTVSEHAAPSDEISVAASKLIPA